MYEYRQIIIRLRSGEGTRAVARAGAAGRNKVREIRKVANEQGCLNSNNPLPSDEVISKFFHSNKPVTSKGSLAKIHSEQIEKWVSQGIQSSTIHATLKRQHGFIGSYASILRFVKKIKDKNPIVTVPLHFAPGESVQVDFGAGPKLIDHRTGEITSTWIFVMVLSWSRHMYAEIVLNQNVHTWLGCHRRAFEFFGGVTKKVIIDNAKCAITRACYYDPEVQRSYADFAEGYNFIISPCPPKNPQKKGRVESGVKYVKNKFVPLREFRDLADANKQLLRWILEEVGNRIHGSTHEKPLTRFSETEKIILNPLPECPPELIEWRKVKVHGDCHIQYEKCRYSVPYKLVKQELWLRAGETTIRIFQDHNLITLHSRLFKPGMHSTIPEHLPPNALAYSMHDPQWCLKQAESVGKSCVQIINHLFASKVLDNLRAAQGIIQLQKTYGAKRLEAACFRAIAFNSLHYRTVKSILKKGIEYEPLPQEKAFDELSTTYTGQGQYCRDPSKILQ